MSVVVAENGVGVAVAVLSGAEEAVQTILYTGYAVLLVLRETVNGDLQESICMTYLLFLELTFERKNMVKMGVKDVSLSLGAGFVVVYTGKIITMPGLPEDPVAKHMGIDEDGYPYGII